MPKLLFDTNALFYYVTAAAHKFGTRTTRQLDGSDLLYSPLSIVELKQKMLKGKLSLSRVDSQVFEALGFRSVSFNQEAAFGFEMLANDDPFDNMLLAQARQLGAKFLTADMKILGLGLDFVLDLTD
jgi:PIN domain nuclease of toxin-antitoxin system